MLLFNYLHVGSCDLSRVTATVFDSKLAKEHKSTVACTHHSKAQVKSLQGFKGTSVQKYKHTSIYLCAVAEHCH